MGIVPHGYKLTIVAICPTQIEWQLFLKIRDSCQRLCLFTGDSPLGFPFFAHSNATLHAPVFFAILTANGEMEHAGRNAKNRRDGCRAESSGDGLPLVVA